MASIIWIAIDEANKTHGNDSSPLGLIYWYLEVQRICDWYNDC